MKRGEHKVTFYFWTDLIRCLLLGSFVFPVFGKMFELQGNNHLETREKKCNQETDSSKRKKKNEMTMRVCAEEEEGGRGEAVRRRKRPGANVDTIRFGGRCGFQVHMYTYKTTQAAKEGLGE